MSVSRAARRIAAGATAAALCVTGFLTAAPAVAETVDDVLVPNGSFEEFTTSDSWVAASWSMTNTVWLTDAAARTGTYSQAVNQWNGSTTLSQQITASEGTYDVSLFVWANESLGASALIANGTSVPIASGGATQIDGSKTWDEIRVEDVPVGADGALEIQIVLPAFTSTTLAGFIDDVTVTAAVDGPEEPEPSDSFLTDPGFEEGGATWDIGGELLDAGRAGSTHAVQHSGGGTQETLQVVEGLEDGYYRLTAWVQNDGGHDEAYIFASGGSDASDAKTAIPRTNFAYDAADTWKRTTLRGVHVTSGRVEVGLHTGGTSPGVVKIDDLALVQDDGSYDLLVGGDISTLTYTEDSGGRFSDDDGRERDPLQILADSGWNIVRIRVYNDPGKGRGDGTYYVPPGYVDAEDALQLSQRAKAAGLQIQLSFHYSDYWTNPGTQMIPHAWQDLIAGKSDADAVTILESEVHDYTKDLLDRMADQGTTPEYVAIGNETRSGMLFPYGTTGNWPNLARFYNAGADAVREAAPDAKVIIHLDDGGNTSTYQTYFTNATNLNVDYDIIGTSFYPFWTNKSAPRFAEFATTISQQFNKPIMVMETGMNWQANTGAGLSGQLSHNGPYGGADSSSPELQRDFMVELFNELQGVPGGLAIGDLYWDPVQIYAGGNNGWAYFEATDEADVNVIDNTTLFDLEGKALPVLDAYRDNTRGSARGTVAGQVLDSAGTPVAGATVTLSADGNSPRTAVSNEYGDYYFARTPGGDHTVSATKDSLGNSGARPVTAVVGTRVDVDLALTGEQQLRSVSGTVRDQDGAGLASATIRISNDTYDSTRLTAADGVFTFASVPDGSYTLSASKGGYVNGSATVVVAGANATQSVELVANIGSVSGRVVGPDGQALSGAVARIGEQQATTDSDGSFVIEGVPAGGGLVVTATKGGYLTTYSSPVAVSPGGTTSGVEFVLPIEVTVPNHSFETAGDGGDATAASWAFRSDPAGAVIRQDRTFFGGTIDGQYAATFWLDSAFTAGLEQTVEAQDAGVYVVRASVYSGVTGGLKMYVKDSAGAIVAERQLPRTGGPQWFDLTANFSDGTFTVGFEAAGNSGDWAVIDMVTAGYLGSDVDVPAPTLVSVSQSELSLNVGGTRVLSSDVAPAAAEQAVLWSSSDDAVATVTNEGQVTAVGAGTATITATSAVDASLHASSTVTVTESGNADPAFPGHDALTADTRGPVSLDVSEIKAGGTVKIQGLDDLERVYVWIASDPVAVGWLDVTNGVATLILPAAVAPGDHRVVVLDEAGELVGWAPLTVTAGVSAGPSTGGATDPGALANTGGGIGAGLGIGLILLLLGAAIVTARRRLQQR